MSRRRCLLVCGTVALVAAALPDTALAHGFTGRQDLPIPKWLFGWGATVVLVASFVALAALWPQPRLEQPAERRLAAVPRILDPIAGAVGVALFAVGIFAGFAGSQTVTDNLLPTLLFVQFWVGLVPVSVLFGDVFMALNPWRAIARTAAWIGGKVSRDGLPAPLPYPERLGRWPAALGILIFAWIELAYTNRDDPSTLAVLGLAYAAVQLVGMSLYGVEPWTRRGDAFGVYFGLFARLAPLRWERGALYARRPLSGVTTLTVVPGTVALLCAMIGSTSFDGFSQGPAWSSLAPDVTRLFRDLGLPPATALETANTVGLVALVLVVAGLYGLGVSGMRWAGEKRDVTEVAQAFVHSLVPIALAYVIAHYFSFLAFNGQAAIYLASDPLGDGSNLLGTAGATIDYTWVGATGIWYVQVGALVLGHVAGLMLAHDRALVLFRSAGAATRSQYWMLAVMIAFTSLGLWLLSSINS
ncbi:MAG: fenitrothion hydrolase [Actinomycetota bacterium]|nr:fenitrothion hydrolase [Actinomycetota bacterium]